MKKEIYEIPFRAQLCFLKNKGIILPENIPYIGMGASYYAILVFKYLQINITPLIASEFNYYLSNTDSPLENAVLISQSGKSAETIISADNVKKFIGIVNEENSSLANHTNSMNTIYINAGEEKLSSSKTYINTLITLYLGFGFDPQSALQLIIDDIDSYEKEGVSLGKKILKYIKKNKVVGIYILGNGPNIGTAKQAALVFAESTKIPIIAMPLYQYEYGVKETAKNSLVIFINPQGVTFLHSRELMEKVKKAGAKVIEISENKTEEKFSPLTSIFPFFFAANYLSKKLKIQDPFIVGEKVTTLRDNSLND